MEYREIPQISKRACRIGLSTAPAHWKRKETDAKAAILALHCAWDLGINLVDTAPAYGFGFAEKIVGQALKTYTGKKDNIIIATKGGISWEDESTKSLFRDASKKRIFQDCEASLKRLEIDCIPIYQVHWPDPQVSMHETARAMAELHKQGKIQTIGVCNFNKEQMKEFLETCPIHILQSPYSIFESDLELEELPFCKKERITVIGYATLCRGLLSGKLTENTVFKTDDIRKIDPKFKKPRYPQYLKCVDKLKKWAENKYHKSVLSIALRWCLDKGIDFPLWGVTQPQLLDNFAEIWGWKLTEEDQAEIATIVVETITDPVGPEFLVPKVRSTFKS